MFAGFEESGREPIETKEAERLEKEKKAIEARDKAIEEYKTKIKAVSDFLGDHLGNAFVDLALMWQVANKDMLDAFKGLMAGMAEEAARMLATSAFKEIMAMIIGGISGSSSASGGGGGPGGGGWFGAAASIIAGAFAGGGTTQPGKSYLVGERGPEIFTPGTTGRVHPNGSGGGNMQVVNNINVESSGDEKQDNRMAQNIARAVEEKMRMQIAKQMRPGGIMNPTRKVALGQAG